MVKERWNRLDHATSAKIVHCGDATVLSFKTTLFVSPAIRGVRLAMII
jgi:hypothetical protein